MPVAVFKQFSAVIFPVIVFIDVDIVVPVISEPFHPFGKFMERTYFQIGAEDGVFRRFFQRDTIVCGRAGNGRFYEAKFS